jgi:hypothetical protein
VDTGAGGGGAGAGGVGEGGRGGVKMLTQAPRVEGVDLTRIQLSFAGAAAYENMYFAPPNAATLMKLSTVNELFGN